MIRIDVLPDDVLLEIFDFYMDIIPSHGVKTKIEVWQSLVHVCRRWRSVVFGSPHRLNLRLVCTPETPASGTLDVWPPLPLLIKGDMSLSSGADNIIMALGQSSRVRQVKLWGLKDRQLDKVLAAMLVPFPDLTTLRLFSNGETPPVVPDSFLGGSAPHLRIFEWDGIPFPGLPKILLSATHLVKLYLDNIPHSGYISPEAMVGLLSMLSSLKALYLLFQSPPSQSRPDWESRRLPPSKRSVIPTLKYFVFKGVIEYLEDLVTYVDASQLDDFYVTFFNQIDFDGPRLAQFISRTSALGDYKAHVEFDDNTASVRFPSHSAIEVLCREPDWQLSSVAQVCNSCLPPRSMTEHLYIKHQYSRRVWKNDAIENSLWLELLLSFPALKNLYLSKDFAPGIAAALQEIVGTEVLPSLQNIFVDGLEPSGPFRENIRQFVAARQLSGHPIAISNWDGDVWWIND